MGAHNFDMIYNTVNVDINDILCPADMRMHHKGNDKMLMSSIRNHGLLLPIIVKQLKGSYVLIDGFRRMSAWKMLYPNEPVPCIVIGQKPDDKRFKLAEECDVEQCKYDAFNVNIVRNKVPKIILENFVWLLHKEGDGYGTIADLIGYKKAGVQKMIDRIKRRNGEDVADKDEANKNMVSRIRRTRTLLKNIRKDLMAITEEERKMFDAIDTCLKENEEFFQEEESIS